MTLANAVKRFGALFCLVALAACGNANGDTATLLRALPGVLAGQKTEPAAITDQQITEVLAATSEPVLLMIVEDPSLQYVMVNIESNGPYRTYGTSTRQVAVLRDGMITATRGIGADLMSSEEDALLAAVRQRRAANVPYRLRFLTPEDVTQTMDFSCATTLGDTIPVQAGTVNTSGRIVTASCQGPDGDFTNAYVVTPGGDIVSARQWIGPVLGYIAAQPLRR